MMNKPQIYGRQEARREWQRLGTIVGVPNEWRGIGQIPYGNDFTVIVRHLKEWDSGLMKSCLEANTGMSVRIDTSKESLYFKGLLYSVGTGKRTTEMTLRLTSGIRTRKRSMVSAG